MYLLFPLYGLDPPMHVGNSLWKVSNIVAKIIVIENVL